MSNRIIKRSSCISTSNLQEYMDDSYYEVCLRFRVGGVSGGVFFENIESRLSYERSPSIDSRKFYYFLVNGSYAEIRGGAYGSLNSSFYCLISATFSD